MPTQLGNFIAQNFRGPRPAEVERDQYANALSRNQVQRLPQTNRVQDLAIQGAEQTYRSNEQTISAQGRKNAAGIAANYATAIANSADPARAMQSTFSNPDFQSAIKALGLPVEQFVFDPNVDTPESARTQAADFARMMGGVATRLENTDIPSNVRVAEYYAGLPTSGDGVTRQVFDEANRAPTIREIGGVQTQVGPAGTRPLGTLAGEAGAAGQIAGAQQGAREAATTAAIPSQTAAKTQAERWAVQIDEGYRAADALPVVNRGLELMDSGVRTGGLEAWKLAVTNAFGVTGADEAELSANLGKAVLSQLRSTFGAQFTQQEGERLASIEAGFGKSTEGNRRLLQQAKALTERVALRGINAAESTNSRFDAEQIRAAMNMRLSSDTHMQFASEAEAATAAKAGRIKPGDRITVGGVSGVWQ
jgi:hypothetical protein